MTTEIIICIAIALVLGIVFFTLWKLTPKDYSKIPLTVVIEKTSTGYTAYCKEMEGLVAVEDNIPALKDQFHEAFLIMLNYQDECKGQYADMYPSDFEITYVEE